MLQALSIQSDILGHSTYGKAMRTCFGEFPDVELTSCWYREGRSFVNGVINKAAHIQVPFLKNNLDYFRARVEWSLGRVSTALMRRKLAERSYGLLHCHTQAHAFGAASVMRSIPTVLSLDMTAYQVAGDHATRYPKTFAPNIAMEHKVFEAAQHLVTWSEWARCSVIRDHGIAPEKVSVITPGAMLQTFSEPDFEPRDKPRLLFIGNDFKRKGGWDLLEVFSQDFSERATLHVVTNQPSIPAMSNVHVHRNVSAYSPAWHSLLRNSDIFVMPSYGEALGLVFQEAAGYGLALIGTNVGGIPEMVFDGDNGFLLEPGDKEALAQWLRILIEDHAQLLHMRRRSREIALERFDAARNFRRMADLFHNVAGQ